MLKDFKEFAIKGNAIDLAIGVVIGAAFSGIVNSLVTDVINPLLTPLTGKINFANLYVNLSGKEYETLAAAKAAGAAVLTYGAFINAIIQFTIIALALFIIIKQINRFRKIEDSKKKCQFCMSEIDIKATRCSYCTSNLP